MFYSNSNGILEALPKNAVPALRLHLPPNLAAAAARDGVALRIELDAGAPDAGLLPVLSLLQRWCETPRPPPFIQLTRRQLGELAAAAAGLPIFVENGKPVAWAHDVLLEAPQASPTPSPPPAAPLRREARSGSAAEPLVIDG